MSNYQQRRMADFLTRKRLARPLARLTSSINPDRINGILSKIVTPKVYRQEGAGRSFWKDRIAERDPHDNSIVGNDRYRISTRTVRHSKPASGYRPFKHDKSVKGFWEPKPLPI